MWIKTDSGSLINLDGVDMVNKSPYSDALDTIYILTLKSGNTTTIKIKTDDAVFFESNLEGMLKQVTTVKTLCSDFSKEY